MARICVTYFLLVAFSGFIVLTRVADGENQDKAVCDQWANISHKVTGSGRMHNCSLRAQDCTVLDCFGAVAFTRNMFSNFLDHDINIRYCFGFTVNSCSHPLSMDFYLQVLSKNISKTFRIVDDTEYELKELNVSIARYGSAYPVLNFVLEKNANSTIHLSVTAQLKFHSQFGDFGIPGLRMTFINDEIIPVKSCSKITTDTNSVPPKTFPPDKCQFSQTIPAITVAPPSVTVKPSETLNKPCDPVHVSCHQREMCDMSLKSPKCVCTPDFMLSSKGDSCIPLNRLGQSCKLHYDCGPNEACNNSVCQCRKYYSYDSWRETCQIQRPGETSGKTTGGVTIPVTRQAQNVTAGTHADSAPAKVDSSVFGQHKIPILVGGGLAVIVVIALIIWGVACYKRRKPRQLSINDRESSAPLIGHDDDNLVM